MIYKDKHTRIKSVGKIIFISFFLIFLLFFLNSFLFYPLFFNSTLFLFFLFAIFYNFLEKEDLHSGYFVAFFSGFLVDIYSNNFFGIYSFLFLITVYFLKKYLKKYVKTSFSF